MPTLPAWYGVLIMAEQWSTPPWEIVGDAPLRWFLRQRFINREKARIHARKS